MFITQKQYIYDPALILFSVRNENPETVDLLIRNGADINARKNDQMTPLHSAATLGYAQIAEMLLQNKADVNARDNKRNTPLHFAARIADYGVIEILLRYGAKKDLKNAEDKTPLQEADLFKGLKDYDQIFTLLK